MKAVQTTTDTILNHLVKLVLLISATLLPVATTSAWAERANTYPGVILSTNTSAVRQAALQQATTTSAFAGLLSEQLNPSAAFLRDRQVSALEAGPIAGRKNLCRAAKIRRIIKSTQGRVRCSQNFEQLAVQEPNDPAYSSYLWGMRTINAPVAWDTTTGTRNAVVAVIDSGIANTHPDLKNNLWINEREIAANGIDDDANGYIDDYHGANTINRTGPGSDDNGHGTHVAGTIGGEGNNSEGVVGVNWFVQLMAVKFLSSSGSGSTANAIRSIEYVIQAKQRGVNVVAINASWGGGQRDGTLFETIKRAASLGILFVAAAGNASMDIDQSPFYPASYSADNIISVASIDFYGQMSSFSNYGASSVHIAAPGSNIYSTIPGTGYAIKSGTSMASPHVAGVAALVHAACPSLGMSALKQVVLNNGALSTNLSGKVSTSSVVNAAGAVLAAQANCPPATPTPTATFTPEPTSTSVPAPQPTTTPIPVIPDPTPIPATPTPTPLPTGGYLFASPSTIPAATAISLNISTGRKTSSAIGLKYVVYPVSGVPIQCPGATIVALPKGARTIRLNLPKEARHFTRIDVSFQTLRDRFSTQVYQTGALPTLVPNTMASRLCKALIAHRFLEKKRS